MLYEIVYKINLYFKVNVPITVYSDSKINNIFVIIKISIIMITANQKKVAFCMKTFFVSK